MTEVYETFVTNASAESLNSGIKGFRAELHGISNLPFFFYRVCKIYGTYKFVQTKTGASIDGDSCLLRI